MKSSLLAAGLMVAGVLFVPSPAAWADQAKSAPKAMHAEKATPVKAASTKAAPMKATASGTIESYDASSKTLVLKHEGRDVSFVLADNATLMAGKAKAAAADLTAGRKAKVEYVVSGTSRTAESIDLDKAPAGQKHAAKK